MASELNETKRTDPTIEQRKNHSVVMEPMRTNNSIVVTAQKPET